MAEICEAAYRCAFRDLVSGSTTSRFEQTAPADGVQALGAFGLLSSHSSLHGSSSYRVPGCLMRAVEVLRRFTKLKCSLMPFLFDSPARRTPGHPRLRAMLLEYPDDPASDYLDGNTCSAIRCWWRRHEGGRVVDYTCRQGRGTNWFTGRLLKVGAGFANARLSELAADARPNSVIAVGARTNKPRT